MKAFLVLLLVIMAAAAAFAYGRTDEPVALAVVAEQTTRVIETEPITLLLSGSFLLVLAGAVRRFSV